MKKILVSFILFFSLLVIAGCSSDEAGKGDKLKVAMYPILLWKHPTTQYTKKKDKQPQKKVTEDNPYLVLGLLKNTGKQRISSLITS